MSVDHDEHYYICDCGGEGMADVQFGDTTEWTWCPECSDGMSKGSGYIEADGDDCEDNPCDVATGAMTL